ncbi:MAG: general stress protein [Planctomycetia bacterium]
MKNSNSVVAVFDTHDEAEQAVRTLQKDGVDMTTLSIVAKDHHTEEHVVGYYNAGDRTLFWGKQGAFWGGFWGLLFGSAFFWVPGVGPLVIAGPLVAYFVAGLEGAALVGGLSALGGALAGIGIPKDSVVQYETEVKNGKLLLIAHGTADEVDLTRAILHRTQATSTTARPTEPADAVSHATTPLEIAVGGSR